MSELNVHLCPETGVCSIIKAEGKKIDLMPDEVSALREAAGNPDAIKQLLAEIDSGFAGELGPEETAQISDGLK